MKKSALRKMIQSIIKEAFEFGDDKISFFSYLDYENISNISDKFKNTRVHGEPVESAYFVVLDKGANFNMLFTDAGRFYVSKNGKILTTGNIATNPAVSARKIEKDVLSSMSKE